MGRVTITIDKREYAIACDDGQEGHILKLSHILNEKAKLLSASIGLVNENLMLAMVGLILADELQDLKNNTGCVPADVLKRADENTAKQIDVQTQKIKRLADSLRAD